jgi:hypothetical protein
VRCARRRNESQADKRLEEKSFEDIMSEFARDGNVKPPQAKTPRHDASPLSSTAATRPPAPSPVPFVMSSQEEAGQLV